MPRVTVSLHQNNWWAVISVFFFCLGTLVGQTRDDVRVSKPIAVPFPFCIVVRLLQRRLQAGFFMLMGIKIPKGICACMYRVVVLRGAGRGGGALTTLYGH